MSSTVQSHGSQPMITASHTTGLNETYIPVPPQNPRATVQGNRASLNHSLTTAASQWPMDYKPPRAKDRAGDTATVSRLVGPTPYIYMRYGVYVWCILYV
jgi:hypothetical protein